MVKFILSYRAFPAEYFAADKLGILQVVNFLFVIIVNFSSLPKWELFVIFLWIKYQRKTTLLVLPIPFL